MAPSCALDESGLRLQLERYRNTPQVRLSWKDTTETPD